MNYRQLGNTGIQVSEIGMGMWGIGSDAYGVSSDVMSIATIHEAYQQGITFFDTADIYGNGRSEELLSDLSHFDRSGIVIATKVGSLPHTGREMPVDLSPWHIGQSLFDSLRRLKTDYIDLYQLHSPPTHLMNNAINALCPYKQEGMIRAIGVSAKSPDDALIAIQNPLVDVIQVNFNMIDQRARENGLLDKCKEAGIGVIARTPLAFGFLTGRYKNGTQFQAPDHRANWSQGQVNMWAESPRHFRQLCSNAGVTPTQLALGYCLSHPAVSTVIPGMMTPLEVLENVNRHVLMPPERIYIEAIYNSNNFFIGE